MTRWGWSLALGAILLAGGRPARAAIDPLPVQGRVRDAVSGAAVAGAEVRAGEVRTLTDSTGAFRLDVPAGPRTIVVAAASYLDHTRRIVVEPGLAPLEITLAPRARFTEELEVRAAGAETENPSSVPLRPAQVLSVAGSLDNIFRVVQLLPGVTATDEFGSRLSVRGGSPDENLTVMDGVEVHNPYRLFGLTSAFNPETIERFEFSAGGFGVRHGDRLSSLLVIENRDGRGERRIAGSSAMSLTDANLIFEGKLPGPKGSFLLTGRRTYYDLVAERFVDVDLPGFADFQLRTSWAPRDGQKLTFAALRSREAGDGTFDGDTPGESGAFLSSVHNDLVSASFQSRVGRGVSKAVVSWYRDRAVFDADAQFRSDDRRSNAPEDDAVPLTAIALEWHHLVRDWAAREDLSLPLGNRHTLTAGFEVHRLRSGVVFAIDGDRNPTQANGSSVRGGAGLPDRLDSQLSYTRGGAWVEDRVRVTDGFTVVPGLRLDRSGLADRAILSPRVAASLGLGPSTRLRASAGRYTQSPGYEKLLQSDYLVDQPGLDYERAVHLVLGVERDLPRGVSLRVELYDKRFDELVAGRLETEGERQVRLARYDFPEALAGEIPRDPLITSTPTNGAQGHAYGFDVFLARGSGGTHTRLTGWASYTFGRATREAYGRGYAFDYDRRHAFSGAGTWRFSPRFTLAATARLASGFPYTPFAGVRVASVEDGERIVPDRDAAGRLVYVVEPGGLDVLNSARLPAYARLDLRATFRPRGETGRWQFYVEVLNALNRKNTSLIDATLVHDPSSDRPKLVPTREGSVPFLPTFGIRFQFD